MANLLESKSEDHEFPFTDRDFQHIRRLIHEYAGINLTESKKDMVYSRLSRRLRATGLTTFHDYLSMIESKDTEEWTAFVNALTTNLTDFYREPHHFKILLEHIATRKDRTPIHLWCSATSTGEEAYSMAMTMVDTFGSYSPPVRILATDIDTNVLSKAKRGVYPMERLKKLIPADLKRFFLSGTGKHSGYARVRKEIRNLVVFRKLNLLEDHWPIRGPFEAIFCRNVLIYFDKPTQLKILQKFVPLMQDDALLFVGHSENLLHASDLFTIRGRTVYTISEKSANNTFSKR